MAFQPGQSGNPAGRPKGTRDWRLSISQSKQDRLKRKLLKMALDGDMRAMQLVVDRLWPRLRSEATPIQLDAASAQLADQGSLIVDAALAGKISSTVARDLLAGLADVARLKELTEHEQRLAALEAQSGAPPWLKQTPPERELLPIRGRHRKQEHERTN